MLEKRIMANLRKAYRKISCALGNHKYRPENLNTMLIGEDYNGLIYRMENKCIYCGHEYRETVSVKMRDV